MIYLFGGEKGGAGKTTVASNFAVYLSRQDRDILIVDGDPQLTISKWHFMRTENSPDERVITCVQKTGDMSGTVESMKNKYDDIIVDAGGRDSDELRSALIIADALYSPIRASQYDIWTVSDMVKLINQAKIYNPKLRSNLFIALCPTNPKITERDDALELLSGDDKYSVFNVMKNVVSERKAYRDCAKTGNSVIETDSKAGDEFIVFAQEILNE